MALERICFGADTWPWFDILAALMLPETVRYIALEGERVVGFIVGDRRRWDQMGWIATIGVHPEYRRRGIGRRLLLRCEQDLDVPRIRLTFRPSNAVARHLYESLGYREVDRWKRYYRGGEDGLVMEKTLES